MRSSNLQQTSNAILNGELVAYATEAVWGLGCNPFDADAVAQLLNIKQRPVEKGLILVASQQSQVLPLIDPRHHKQAKQVLLAPSKATDRATTWVVPVHKDVPYWVTGGRDSIAVRLSGHATVRGLCDIVKMPLVSTSANPAGCLPAKDVYQVRRYFADDIVICQGRIGQSSQPSMIKNLLTQEIIRG